MKERPSFERPSYELRERGSFTARAGRVYAAHARGAPPDARRSARRTGSASRAGWSTRTTRSSPASRSTGSGSRSSAAASSRRARTSARRARRRRIPELLDWLATEFMANKWSQKAILRTIVLSATYRQSSAVSPALEERDPVQPAARARSARPHGSRDGPRRRARGERPAQREDVRPERLPAPADGHLEHAVQRRQVDDERRARTATAAASTRSGGARRPIRAS